MRRQRLLGRGAGGLEQVQGHLPPGDGGQLQHLPGAARAAGRSRVRSTSPTDGGTGTRSRCRSWAPTIQRDSSTTKNGLPPVRSCTAEASDRSPGEPSWAVSSAATSSAASPVSRRHGGARLAGEPGQAVGDGLGQLLADRARGDDQQDRRPRQVPGEQAEQLHRGGVGALQVVEDDEHRPVGRGGRQPAAEVLEQPEPGRVGVVPGTGRASAPAWPSCSSTCVHGHSAGAPASSAQRLQATDQPAARPASAAASASRVLPIPASPSTTTTAARPAADLLGDAPAGGRARRRRPTSGSARRDRRGRRRGRSPAARGRGMPVEQLRVLAQHGPLEVAQLRAGVDAELLAEQLGAAAAARRAPRPAGRRRRGR